MDASKNADRIKTTIHISRNLHKWLRMWAVENDTNLGDIVEEALEDWARRHSRVDDEPGESRAKARRPNLDA